MEFKGVNFKWFAQPASKFVSRENKISLFGAIWAIIKEKQWVIVIYTFQNKGDVN